MGTIIDIDIDFAITVLRVLAAALTGVALLCWARAGARFLAPGMAMGLTMVLVVLIVEIDSGWMRYLDTTAEAWMSPLRSGDAMAAATDVWFYMSDPIYFPAAVMACAIVFSWRARSAKPGAVLVVAVGSTYALELVLKATVGRATATVAGLQDPYAVPSAGLAYLHSFPSGHVAVIGVFVGTVAVLLGSGRSAGAKAQLAALVGFCLVFIGMHALYIRAHTATDVVGGMVLAGAVIAAGSVVLAVRAPVPQRHPGVRRRTADANVRAAQLPVRRQRVPVS